MLKEEVIRIRTLLKDNNVSTVRVICDNMQIITESNDFLMWDDENEMLHVFRTNVDHYSQARSPFSFFSTTYEFIQYIEGVFTRENAMALVDNALLGEGLIKTGQDEYIKKFINRIQPSNPRKHFYNYEPFDDHINGTNDVPPNVQAPFAAMVGTTPCCTFEEGISLALECGETMKIVGTNNIEESITVPAGQCLNIDLNGGSIIAPATHAFVVDGGSLNIYGNGTVRGGSGGSYCSVFTKADAKVSIFGGNFEVGADGEGLGNTCIYGTQQSEITIYNGTFSTDAAWEDKYYVLNMNNAATGYIKCLGGTYINYDPTGGDDKIESNFVEGGYLSVESTDREGNKVFTVVKDMRPDALVDANGNAFKTIEDAIASADTLELTLLEDINREEPILIETGKDITIDLNGKNITSAQDSFKCTGGNLVLNGNGTVRAGSDESWCAIWALGDANVTINNGNYSVGPDGEGLGNTCVYCCEASNIVINNGTFSTDVAWNDRYYVLNLNNSATGMITAKGGKFINYDPMIGDDKIESCFVAEGYMTTKTTAANGDVVYEVCKCPPQVTDAEGNTYDILQDAIDANEVVNLTLLEDITVDENTIMIPAGKTVTIDLNDKSITAPSNDAITVDGNLTINGPGNVTGGSGATYNGIWSRKDSVLTINGGSYSTGHDENGLSNATIYIDGNTKCYITGGEFTTETCDANGYYFVINKKNNTNAEFIVSGGIFEHQDPAVGDDAMKGCFLAKGYISTLIDGKYHVIEAPEDVVVQTYTGETYTSIQDAIDDNDTVTINMVSDIEVVNTITIPEGKEVTINLNNCTIDAPLTDTIAVDGVLNIHGDGNVIGGTQGTFNSVWGKNQAVISIYGGNYNVRTDEVGGGNSTCYMANEAICRIYNGYFTTEGYDPANGYHYVINKKNGSLAKFEVYGGQFEYQDPSLGDDHDLGNWLAEGYKSVESVSENGNPLFTVVKI